uniref:Uncharacterized protein n=1 Tax=Heterorhabditis bacteriophora TaxID=37862 RepID=A0A1I7WYL5_HETBA
MKIFMEHIIVNLEIYWFFYKIELKNVIYKFRNVNYMFSNV